MIIIKNGALVTPQGLRRADLAMEGDKIVRIAAAIEPAEGDTVEDAAGCWVFPGFIDGHTHMQCWTGMDWTADSFETGTRAAVCGGTTTIVDYATADRGVTMPDALAEWHRRADGPARPTTPFIWHSPSGTSATAPTFGHARGGRIVVKTYFAYDHLRLDDAETLEVLEELKYIGGILCVHCENGTLVNELQKRVFEQGIHGPEGHALSRPDVCEAEAVSRLLYLAHLAGDAPVNVVHLSTKLGLEAIRAAKARGQKNIYVETCPQYLMLDDTCYLEQGEDGFAGAKYVMSRRCAMRATVRHCASACGRRDRYDRTDHCSFNLHGQKDRGRDDFRAIPNGGPGVEHRPVAIATSFEGQLGPEDLCRLMSENPARLWHVSAQGMSCRGSDADVCVWDPKARWTISAATQHQAVDYTPLEGFEAHGRAKAVFVNGVLAACDGEPTGAQPGRYVPATGRPPGHFGTGSLATLACLMIFSQHGVAKRAPSQISYPLEAGGDEGAAEGCLKRSAIVGSLSVSTWLSMTRAVLSSITRISALSTCATRSGVAMSVSSQPQRSQKSSGRWTASWMGLPSPEAPTIRRCWPCQRESPAPRRRGL
ncbi:MAG: dihydropyrimidinase [Collinsella sp.]